MVQCERNLGRIFFLNANKEREFKNKYFQDPNYLIKGIDTF